MVLPSLTFVSPVCRQFAAWSDLCSIPCVDSQLPSLTYVSLPCADSSLRGLIEKPPVVGKELMPLSSLQLTGFRLHAGPVSPSRACHRGYGDRRRGVGQVEGARFGSERQRGVRYVEVEGNSDVTGVTVRRAEHPHQSLLRRRVASCRASP